MYEGAAGNAEIRLKTLTAKIEAKEDELLKLERKLATRTASVEQELARLDKLKANSLDLTTEARDGLQRVLDEIKQRGDERVRAATRLKDIELEIRQRKAYQAEQEELIDTSVREGNQQLNSIHREIKLAENEREDLLAKTHDNQLQLKRLESMIQERDEALGKLDARYEAAAQNYRTQLSVIKTEISQAEIDRDKINAEADQKLLDLKAERAEIEVAREVVGKQREEVMGEKRKLESMRIMYGL